MFERFTEKAIKVMLLAQEEARAVMHKRVGAEQILLGLIGEGSGIAADVLTSHGVTLMAARKAVKAKIGIGTDKFGSWAEIPFTPNAKKVLEASWYEAASLGDNYIGTEHLMLGLLTVNDTIAMQVLRELTIDDSKLFADVLETVAIRRGKPSTRGFLGFLRSAEREAKSLSESLSHVERISQAVSSAVEAIGEVKKREQIGAELLLQATEIAERLSLLDSNIGNATQEARARLAQAIKELLEMDGNDESEP